MSEDIMNDIDAFMDNPLTTTTKRKPNFKIINQVRREKAKRAEDRKYRQVEPNVWIK